MLLDRFMCLVVDHFAGAVSAALFAAAVAFLGGHSEPVKAAFSADPLGMCAYCLVALFVGFCLGVRAKTRESLASRVDEVRDLCAQLSETQRAYMRLALRDGSITATVWNGSELERLVAAGLLVTSGSFVSGDRCINVSPEHVRMLRKHEGELVGSMDYAMCENLVRIDQE